MGQSGQSLKNWGQSGKAQNQNFPLFTRAKVGELGSQNTDEIPTRQAKKSKNN